jgi:hypothetical protein
MKKMFIQEKLSELGIESKDIMMGDFDIIGEYTAKKNRHRSHHLYKSKGCFFRPNYERGILMYYLVAKKKIKSALEIGFGRGYSTLCMAKAMCDHNIDGSIVTVDPNFNEEFLKQLRQIFPKEWFAKIEFVKLTSDEYFKKNKEKDFEFIYIDGDHRYESVKNDWENSKNSFTKALLFDDYCERQQQDIECAKLINEISGFEKELIKMDRRIFFDDRRIPDEEIDYGQVLIER